MEVYLKEDIHVGKAVHVEKKMHLSLIIRFSRHENLVKIHKIITLISSVDSQKIIRLWTVEICMRVRNTQDSNLDMK